MCRLGVSSPAGGARAASCGSTSRSAARFSKSRASGSAVSSTSEAPSSCPCAARKVLAMPPPMSTRSALFNNRSSAAILSETFAPPRIATKGRTGFCKAPSRYCTSRVSRWPAKAGNNCASPTLEACARWPVPKASFTNTSPRRARLAAKSASLLVSPAWKRVFSNSKTAPDGAAAMAASASAPTQSATKRTSISSSADNTGVIGASENSGRRLPFGRPKCDSRMSARGLSARISRIVGSTARIRVSSATIFPSRGTLKSTRYNTR